MGMAAGRAAMVVVAAAAAVLLLLLAGAYADCYGDCFNDCMGKFKDMRDYCSYACDKVCNPDADDATLQRPRPLAVVGPAALVDRDHPLDKKQQDEDADAVRPAALPDHPFHETHGAVTGEPDPGHVVVRPARVPVVLP